MKCSVCGYMNDEDSKFCIKCGTEIIAANEGEPSAILRLDMGEDTAEKKTISVSENNRNEFMDKLKIFADGFWKYYVDVILRPTTVVNHLQQRHYLNGLIIIVLFSLLLPLQTYFMFSGNSFFRPSFTSVVVVPFFYLLLFVAGLVGLIYAAMKIGKIDGDFLTVLSRFGGLLAIPVSFQIISLILLKVLPSFSIMFNLLAYSGVLFAILYTFQSFVHNKELKGDLMYYIYGILFVLFILFGFLGRTYIENEVGNLFNLW